ncbi:MAG: FeoB-associated Cys-rich membrane protein [Ruminococcus sp.]|nr:FeoB-associated Cys-rich membrane protein [Ruminococcus sp.]MDO4418858.1 FeoB-associated Cys-rich membrane protein [Ruminococcus sp.]
MTWQTWLVAGIIAVVFGLIVAKGIYNKKKGKSSCSCGCSGCAMKDSCHKAK